MSIIGRYKKGMSQKITLVSYAREKQNAVVEQICVGEWNTISLCKIILSHNSLSFRQSCGCFGTKF